jgi:hypothetical protein
MSDISDLEKIDLIRMLMERGRYADLYELMMGVSKYNVCMESFRSMLPDEERAWQMASHHLEFLSKYGQRDWVEENGKRYFSYPEEFEKWLDFGAPCIEMQELYAYLEENKV